MQLLATPTAPSLAPQLELSAVPPRPLTCLTQGQLPAGAHVRPPSHSNTSMRQSSLQPCPSSLPAGAPCSASYSSPRPVRIPTWAPPLLLAMPVRQHLQHRQHLAPVQPSPPQQQLPALVQLPHPPVSSSTLPPAPTPPSALAPAAPCSRLASAWPPCGQPQRTQQAPRQLPARHA